MKKILSLILVSSLWLSSQAQVEKTTPIGRKNDVTVVQGKFRVLGLKNNLTLDSILYADDKGNFRQRLFVGGSGGPGTVTSIIGGYGMLGGTITSSGTFKVDSTEIVNFNQLNSSLLNKWGLSGNTGTNPAVNYLGSADTTLRIRSFGRKSYISEKWKNTEYGDTIIRTQKLVQSTINFMSGIGPAVGSTFAYINYDEIYSNDVDINDGISISPTGMTIYHANPSIYDYLTIERKYALVNLDTTIINIGSAIANNNYTFRMVLNPSTLSERFPSKRIILHDNFTNTDTEWLNPQSGDTLAYAYTVTAASGTRNQRFIIYNEPKGAKMGVNTGIPDASLHVIGDVKIVDGTQGSGKIFTSDAYGRGSWQTASGLGEIATAINLGGGLANYSTKVGSEFRFNSFLTTDFDLTGNLIGLDYTNGQTANGSTKGFLTAADWTTFNNKGSVTSVGAGYGILGGAITGTGTHSADTASINGLVSKERLNNTKDSLVSVISSLGGEVNTASTLGAGLTLYDSKSGVDLRFNSMSSSDFNLASNLISIDYTNGQTATGSVKGFLSSADWTTFNNKGSVSSVGAGYGILGGAITGSGTHSADTASINGLVSKERLNGAKDSLVSVMTSLAGEVNTGANLGGGLANYSTKVGADLRFNSFTLSDFNLASNLISIDYTNGQTANGSTKGFLSSTDWTTFNNKGSGSVTNVQAASGNGFTATILNPTTTPLITIFTTVNGMMKGNGTSASAAVLGTDYGSVATGGTGRTTNTTYSLLAGGTTATGALQQVGAGTAGQVLTYVGLSALPTWQTPATPGEVNTGSTLGAGLTLYDSKSGVDLRFNSMLASDFNLASNLISIDYTNGQTANGSTKGFLSSADWTTFNNKGSGSVTSVGAGYGILGGAITGSGTHSVDTASINGLVSKERLNGAKDSLISLMTAGSGEINTGSNLGGGLANYSTKVGFDLRFNSFTLSDFNLASNLISIDYTNGQTANTTTKGFLTAADWNTFNNKGSGTVTTTSVAVANGFSGTVATASSTPAITIGTTITGMLKGNGTAISAAVLGTDYGSVATGGTGRTTNTAYSIMAGGTTATGALQQVAAGTAGQVLTYVGLSALPTWQTPALGEVNTASTLGAGLALYDSKSGVDLRFNSMLASDFNLAANILSIDYTNGQTASGSTKGFLSSADWTTFNNKGSGSVTSVGAGYGILGGAITGSGSHSADTTSINGLVSKERLNHAKDSLVALISAGGESNTGSNLGGGLANYSTKVGADLRFNSFQASDFNLASNLISIDYTNGQTATGSVKGFLSSADWTTFNNKGSVSSVASGYGLTGGTITSTGTLVADTANVNGLVSKQRLTNSINSILNILALADSLHTDSSYAYINYESITGKQTLQINVANGGDSGIVSKEDWNIFNNKESALTISTGLTRSVNTITNNLITGVNGGQTITAGTNAGNNLTLLSTSNATKGKIIFGTASAYDQVNDRFGISQLIPTSKLHIQTALIGTTQSDANGIILSNPTPGAVGAQQMSPGIVWDGNGWKTAATAGSQNVKFKADILPVQGTTNPAGLWQLARNINNAGYVNMLTVNSVGDVTAANAIIGTTNVSAGSQLNFTANSSSSLYRTTNAGSDITPSISVWNGTTTAGTHGLAFNQTDDIMLSASNGTRQVVRGGIILTGLVNTLGNESGAIAITTQSAGGVATEKMRIASTGEVGIGGTPGSSLKLDVQSTTQAFAPPRMTAAQADAIVSPVDASLIYVTSTNGTFTQIGFWGRENGIWIKL